MKFYVYVSMQWVYVQITPLTLHYVLYDVFYALIVINLDD